MFCSEVINTFLKTVGTSAIFLKRLQVANLLLYELDLCQITKQLSTWDTFGI